VPHRRVPASYAHFSQSRRVLVTSVLGGFPHASSTGVVAAGRPVHIATRTKTPKLMPISLARPRKWRTMPF
jgi:hypothetical protein